MKTPANSLAPHLRHLQRFNGVKHQKRVLKDTVATFFGIMNKNARPLALNPQDLMCGVIGGQRGAREIVTKVNVYLFVNPMLH